MNSLIIICVLLSKSTCIFYRNWYYNIISLMARAVPASYRHKRLVLLEDMSRRTLSGETF